MHIHSIRLRYYYELVVWMLCMYAVLLSMAHFCWLADLAPFNITS